MTARAIRVHCTDVDLVITLDIGGMLYVPLKRFWRLEQATFAQRQNVQIRAGGMALRWPELDEDISVPHLFP